MSLYSFCDPIIVFRNLLMSEMSDLLRSVLIWVKLPSSAPVLWFGVLSLVWVIFCQPWFFGSIVTSSELKVFRAVLYLFEESYADVCLMFYCCYFCFSSYPDLSSRFLSAGWCLFVRVGPWFCLLLFLKGPTVWTGYVSFLPLCWVPVAGLHCLLPSTS